MVCQFYLSSQRKTFLAFFMFALICFVSFAFISALIYKISFLLNTFESVLMRWMKLEPIIQSEVSQKEKHQYSKLTHIYGI